MNRKEHHIVSDRSKREWKVERENSLRASGHYPTKHEAIDAARRMSKNQRSEMIIHDRNGVIRSADSHGKDPCPPRDKR